MQVQELVVGDWVQNPLGYKAVILDIRRYDDGRDAFHYVVKIGEDSNNWQRLAVEELLPIPLTPEILEKNGFYLNGIEDYNPSCNIDYGKWSYADENGFDVAANSSDIKYVHELQHALRLCGIEKEIVL